MNYTELLKVYLWGLYLSMNDFDPGRGWPDSTNKNTRCPVGLEFQINNE